nr:ERAD-associated E3 ubiquitin-protein ligase HRD1B-like [Tanacetum cinerariifolium]
MNTTQSEQFAGANLSNTSPQDQTGDAAGSGNISRQQKRVQAAAAAASIYQKSFVYPLPSSLTWSSRHALPPNQSTPGTGMNNVVSSSEIDDSIPNNPATYSSFQLPVQAQGITPNPEDAWATNLQLSVTQLEAQKRTIQNQIEV